MKLSEEFIREFLSKKIDWNCISTYQELSEKYIKENLHKDRSIPMLVDVPCKQCRLKVNISDKVCWYCGVSAPAQEWSL